MSNGIKDKVIMNWYDDLTAGYELPLEEQEGEYFADDFFSLFLWKMQYYNMAPFVGTYVLWNRTRGKYYVGQSKNVPGRINQHINGKGNPDVYFDMRSGDEFAIRLIPFVAGGDFKSPAEQEKYYIYKYDAYTHGYNRNSGLKQ